MNAVELIAKVRAANPGLRYAVSRSGYSIGEWIPSVGRFVPVYLSSLWNGETKWTFTGGREFLTNGEPMVKAGDWLE